mmetsp:Transcript_21360/g.48164  ORF Transcript_21360/g.48164 Transcript_21360/m.48164 type:complete len:307 (-) Transcript_21360:187-1107(-)
MMATILKSIATNVPLYVISDSSATEKRMTFGWILSTTKGQRLASSHGSCAGRPSSLQAEASGILSSSLFIMILQSQYHCIFHQGKLGFMADNLELITRLNDHRRYTKPYPNTTLGAEFDLTKQIHLLHTEHQLPSSFRHVKGYQDQTTDYAKLDLPAQLNCDANQLAGRYYYHCDAVFYKHIDLLPSCPEMLTIHKVDVTSQYKKQLMRAYTEPRYMAHHQQRFHWDHTTVSSIAWRVLKIALQRIHCPTLCTKVCNDLLPTNRILYQWGHLGHHLCPLCSSKETTEHMIICGHPSRLKLRQNTSG